MPFVSRAQQRWAHANPDKFGKKNLEEFDAATKGAKLPERSRKHEYSRASYKLARKKKSNG